ncbi:Germin-like protein [Actinidia chinensis var. chinensis]|uniref:Germin-like protein n=1 Tax=Actinidia chinensis var. chinensis TaxID=1590841 RepID=A0A2R6PW63_ACTCC|nr:Germin-like protein [Actinidia chinensis var. chinensis]
MRVLVKALASTTFKVLKASLVEFPSFNGQCVSYAVLQYPAGTVNSPHTHPRASELLFLFRVSLEVGFVDTTNKPFTQMSGPVMCLCFPRDLFTTSTRRIPLLLHWPSPLLLASVLELCRFLPLYSTLASLTESWRKSFKTDSATIEKLKAGLAH